MKSAAKQVWQFCGVMAFWLTWPVAYFLIHDTQRARVIVRYDNKILLVRGWYGSGQWQLPGGGVKRGETFTGAACRELEEEIGLQLSGQDLRKLGGKATMAERGIQFFYQMFIAECTTEPAVSCRYPEIVAYKWVDMPHDADDKSLSDDARQAIRAIVKQG